MVLKQKKTYIRRVDESIGEVYKILEKMLKRISILSVLDDGLIIDNWKIVVEGHELVIYWNLTHGTGTDTWVEKERRYPSSD